MEKSRNATGAPVERGEPIDPFNNRLIMPLADFVRHPVVEDTLANGQAMQVRNHRCDRVSTPPVSYTCCGAGSQS